MKNSLINKIAVAAACFMAVTFAGTRPGCAADTPVSQNTGAAEKTAQPAPAADENDLSFLEEDMPDDTAASENGKAAVQAEQAHQDNAPVKQEAASAPAAASDAVSGKNETAPSPLLDVQPFPDNSDLNNLEADANKAQIDSTEDVDSVIPEIGEDKSPFEKFGNAILSKVDNDLFNQMSNIEKQTTLLRLELRREELKSRVEALRNARIKAQQEEEARVRAEAEKQKDLEAKRQAMIIAEQEKLKAREIELEKVRQGKIINDYMNEMLVMNQKWISKTAELQDKIKKQEEENKALHKDFRTKMTNINGTASSLRTKAENAVNAYNNKVEALNEQISQLKDTIKEREQAAAKAAGGDSDGAPGENAIDMSKDYAIMDITGKGDEIIAKIVSRDGTTFTVHKGSKLKNGEVVTSITDHYISFDNNGVQSYLYTGGTIMEYEPEVTFNGSDKMPLQTDKQIIKGDTSNKLGKDAGGKQAEEAKPVRNRASSNAGISFGTGTFVQ